MYLAPLCLQTVLYTMQPTTTIGMAEQQHEHNGVSEPPIKLVHVLNPGEREYLSPNLIGLQNIAMTFLPKSLNFINVIDAFREIVNGVRYEIVLNAQDTEINDKNKNKDLVCRLVILEKPWIRSDWGDKYRELQHSNCTREQQDSDTSASNFVETRNKIANDKYNAESQSESQSSYYNAVTRNELSAAEMHKLEAQIFTVAQTEMPTNAAERVDMTTMQMQSIELETTTPTMPSPELSDNEKKWLDDFLAVGALNFEQMLHEQRDKQQQQDIDTQFNNYPNGEELAANVEQVKTAPPPLVKWVSTH